MPKSLRLGRDLLFLMGVSFFTLFLAVLFGVFPPVMSDAIPYRKPLIGSIYGLICALGMWAAFSPKKCSRMFSHQKEAIHMESGGSPGGDIDAEGTSHFLGLRIVHGHHPSCERFSSHEFRVGKKTFCIGCMGLFTGATAALVGTIAFFFAHWSVGQHGLFLTSLGVLGVALALLQFPLLNTQRPYLRFSLNAFFVLGTFLIIVGMDSLVRSGAIDLFFLLASVFWLLTRIALSQWDHERICRACGLPCELGEREGGRSPTSGRDVAADDDKDPQDD